jgi:hypothetical protein
MSKRPREVADGGGEPDYDNGDVEELVEVEVCCLVCGRCHGSLCDGATPLPKQRVDVSASLSSCSVRTFVTTKVAERATFSAAI